MQQACEDQAALRGVYVETQSGDQSHTICSIGGRDDVKHVVIVENLMTYPAFVACESWTGSYPRRIRFVSSDPGVTAGTWNGEATIGEGRYHIFDHVTLRTVSPGVDQIHVKITVDWALPGKEREISLSFPVSA